MYLNFSFQILKKNIVLNLIYIMELAVMLIAFCMVQNIWKSSGYEYQTSKSFMKSYNGIFYSPIDRNQVVYSDAEAESILKSDSHFLGWSETDSFFSDQLRVVTYDKISSELLKINVKSGTWYTQGNAPEGTIPCVVYDSPSNIYKTGDTIKEGVNRFYVTGTLYSGERYWDGRGYAIGSLTGDLENSLGNFTNMSFSESGVTVLCGVKPQGMKKDDIGFRYQSRIAYFDRSISSQAFRGIYDKLYKIGSIESLQNMTLNTKQEFYDDIRGFLPFAVVFAVFVVFGIISLSLLNKKIVMSWFSVYYICGLDWRRNIWIYILYSGIQSVCAYVLMIIGVSYINAQNYIDIVESKAFILSTDNLVMGVLVIILFACISFLPIEITKQKYTPISILKNL